MSKFKICLVSSQHLSYNPRLLKEADALHEAGYSVRVVAMHLEPAKAAWDARLMAGRSWQLETVNAARDSIAGRLRWLIGALLQRFASQGRGLEGGGIRHYSAMRRLASREKADLFIGHNLQALPVAAAAAQRWGAKLGFDAEDFHRGEIPERDEPQRSRREWIEAVEQEFIPRCDHLTAASDGIGDAYAASLGVRKPVTILNVFPLAERSAGLTAEALREERQGDGVSLYWYSQVIGRDRGLDDALNVLAQIKSGVRLHLRGRWANGYERDFRQRCQVLGIENRVHVLPPVPPEQLIERAAQHDVGLALEVGETQNRRIAVTNKILNYFLAGLAIAATDVPGQRAILANTPEAGFLFTPGDVVSLTKRLRAWIDEPQALRAAKASSLHLGISRYCWDKEKEKLLRSVHDVLGAGVGVRN